MSSLFVLKINFVFLERSYRKIANIGARVLMCLILDFPPVRYFYICMILLLQLISQH